MSSLFKAIYAYASPNVKGVLNPQNWDRIFLSIDSRLDKVEGLIPSVEKAITDLANIGIERINSLLLPAFEKVRRVTSLGFLMATSTTPHALIEGTTQKYVIPEGDVRDLFTPGPYVHVTRTGSIETFAYARTLSYNRETGEYVCLILAAFGSAEIFSDWEITAGVALSLQNETRYLQMTELRTATVEAASAASTSAGIASSAATTANNRASFADLRASDANSAATRAGTAADRAETAAGTVDGSIFILKDGTRAFTGKARFAPSAAGGAAFNIPAGSDPSAPAEGDVWNAGGGVLRGFIGGATHRFAFLGLDQSWNGQQTFNRPIRIAQGGTSVAPADGDLRISTGGLHARFGGSEKTLATTEALRSKAHVALVHAISLAR